MKYVLVYKQTMQVKSRAAMDELVKLSEEMGGYDRLQCQIECQIRGSEGSGGDKISK